MRTPTRVVIEIDADSYKTTVFEGEKVLACRSATMLSASASRADEKGDFIDDFPEDEDFGEALDGVQGEVFEIAAELRVTRDCR